MKKLILSVCAGLLVSQSYAQTQIWSDNFEDTGSPSSGSRASSYTGGSGGPPFTRYFLRAAVSEVNVSTPYSGVSGKFWAAEDVDGAPTGTSGEQSSEQSVTWTNINIAGQSNLSFRGKFATGIATVWDHGSVTPLADYCTIQYQINGTGPWTTILDFRPNIANSASGALAIDGNNDGLGDGTALNGTFTQFTVNIPATGNTLGIRCLTNTNSLQEEMAFDDFLIFAGTPLPVDLISFSGKATPAGNELDWSTAMDANSKAFEIESSNDGRNFVLAGTVNTGRTSDGKQLYTYLDERSQAGVTYYRLKQIDVDGLHEYSTVINIRRGDNSDIKVYPNPASNKLMIRGASAYITGADIKVINLSGAVMPVRFTRSVDVYECDLAQLPTGIYVLQVSSANDENYSYRFIKK